jgi:hypothetical protein
MHRSADRSAALVLEEAIIWRFVQIVPSFGPLKEPSDELESPCILLEPQLQQSGELARRNCANLLLAGFRFFRGLDQSLSKISRIEENENEGLPWTPIRVECQPVDPD